MCGNVVTLKSTRQVEDGISLAGLCSYVRQCDWPPWAWPLFRLPVHWVGQDRLCRVLEGQPQGSWRQPCHLLIGRVTSGVSVFSSQKHVG